MKLYETCLRCGRKLKNEESRKLGFGKVCWEKYNANTQIKLFNTEEILNETEKGTNGSNGNSNNNDSSKNDGKCS